MRSLFCVLLLAISSIAVAQQAPSPGTKPGATRPNPDPEAAARTIAISAGDTTSPAAQEVMKFERDMEAAVVRGDVAAVREMLADDFVMIHGDTWMMGGKALLADNKESFLKRVANKQYLARDISTVKVELHGDIAILLGQYISENSPGGLPRSWFSVWYERVYAKRNGKWVFLSHRTVHGPSYGPDRDSVKAQ